MKVEGGASLVGAESLSQKASSQSNKFNTEPFAALGRTFAFTGHGSGIAALSGEVVDSSMAGASQKASGALAAKKLTRIAPFYSVSMG